MVFDILGALQKKYPGTQWVQAGGTYAGLQAVKDDGNGQAIPDPDNMITEEEYNTAIAEYKVIHGWIEVRKKRDQMLKDSDHKVFSDYPITAEKKAEWIAYRDKLRTIPQRYTDPSAVIYPVEPK